MKIPNTQDPITQDSKVAIIGAGPAGLSTAKHLLVTGIFMLFCILSCIKSPNMRSEYIKCDHL